MSAPARRPASALLMTLFILIGIGGIVLATTRMVLSTARVGSNQSDAAIAARMAQSGLEEGLLKLKGRVWDGVESDGSGGLTGAPDCSGLGAHADPGCPSYTYSIKKSFAADPGQTILGDSDLPLNQDVIFHAYDVWGGGSSTTIKIEWGGLKADGTPVNSVNLNEGQWVTLTRLTTLGGRGIFVSGSYPLTLVEKNYACVQATGVSGVVSVRKRAVIHYDPSTGVFSDPSRVSFMDNALCSDHFLETP